MKFASFFNNTPVLACVASILTVSAGADEQQGPIGGPTVDEARQALQARIQEQSEGQAFLFGFRHIITRPLEMEIQGKLACAVDFEAGVEFVAPCHWASRHQGRPLTYFLLKSEPDHVRSDQWDLIEVKEEARRYVMQGYALFTPMTNGWVVAGFGQRTRPVRQSAVPDEASVDCVNQLKQIGLAFRIWAMDHDDRFPFNTSAQSGGTLELCSRGVDGFDASALLHFQVLSNELHTPRLLVCPADPVKQPAADFRRLQATNVSYSLRSGTHIDESNPGEILVRCPVHGHVGLCDGSVRDGTAKTD